MKINIKCLVLIDEKKIEAIKLIRAAFGLGLKDAKDLVDNFHNTDTILHDYSTRLTSKQLTRQLNSTCSRDTRGMRILDYSVPNHVTKTGFNLNAFLEKIKYFASLALDNEEAILAEDLLHVYNKHSEEE